MKNFSQFVEAVGKTAVFTFGRFNPPTIGHQKLLQATIKAARKEGGKAYIFGSFSQDKKKNPLSHSQKMHYLSKMFPKEMLYISKVMERYIKQKTMTHERKQLSLDLQKKMHFKTMKLLLSREAL